MAGKMAEMFTKYLAYTRVFLHGHKRKARMNGERIAYLWRRFFVLTLLNMYY